MAPGTLEVLDGYCRFRATGTATLEEATQIGLTAIAQCREQKMQRLLLDSRKLTGFGPLTPVDRYFFIDQWSRAAAGTVKVAVLVPAEELDPRHFGRTVGANRGMQITAFANEAEAVAWLLDPRSV